MSFYSTSNTKSLAPQPLQINQINLSVLAVYEYKHWICVTILYLVFAIYIQLGMHRSDTQDRYRLRSGHFLRIGYRRDETDPNPILCVYYSVLLLSPTKAL